MPDYTLTNDYSATGEGITYWLMYMYARSPKEVVDAFVRREGDYFAQGCTVREGLDLGCREANLLLSPKVRSLIEAGGGNLFYFASVHVNYS